ncbi:olfactory receptor 1361-like [Rhinatrema bivittatum]|uniref:olfactory receptor 1361-like n=1 Tax=Rhinatrema bivittatum TaxID=194408 RepID=UPI001127DE46|nr:olfactory receptor 1361-like [Rhinatrema bivittatum]
MEGRNETDVIEFILLGFSDLPQHQALLFILFLTLYTATLSGNIAMITVISADSHLHRPMYFFLGNLSLVDLLFISTTVPKMLNNFLSERKSISFSNCLLQMYFVILFGTAESFLLAVMAYDRYVAICNPLRYAIVMTRRFCLQLVMTSWIAASLHSLLHALLTARLLFCRSNTIHHFFCELAKLLKLSCSDTSINELVIFIEGSFVVIQPFILIAVSYLRIASAIFRMTSTQGRSKVFSTCSSHLAVVALFYGTVISLYFRPSAEGSLEQDRAASVMYSIVAPLLNPFIYSLRNHEVKGALRRLFSFKALHIT